MSHWTTRTWQNMIIAGIAGRQLVGLIHGMAHHELQIPMANWQHAFIWLVITILPIVLLILFWRGITRSLLVSWGIVLVAGSMFGLYFHFGPINPDHVSQQPTNAIGTMFWVTAVLLVAVEILCLLTCLGAWQSRARVDTIR